jgi:hypothetical protein
MLLLCLQPMNLAVAKKLKSNKPSPEPDCCAVNLNSGESLSAAHLPILVDSSSLGPHISQIGSRAVVSPGNYYLAYLATRKKNGKRVAVYTEVSAIASVGINGILVPGATIQEVQNLGDFGKVFNPCVVNSTCNATQLSYAEAQLIVHPEYAAAVRSHQLTCLPVEGRNNAISSDCPKPVHYQLGFPGKGEKFWNAVVAFSEAYNAANGVGNSSGTGLSNRAPSFGSFGNPFVGTWTGTLGVNQTTSGLGSYSLTFSFQFDEQGDYLEIVSSNGEIMHAYGYYSYEPYVDNSPLGHRDHPTTTHVMMLTPTRVDWDDSGKAAYVIGSDLPSRSPVRFTLGVRPGAFDVDSYYGSSGWGVRRAP